MLLYDYEEYESRHLTNPMNDAGNGETCYRAFHCSENNLIMHLRTFCPSWVNWGMNISYDVSETPMTNKTMFKSGAQCLGGIG